jgi:hypothetical protein
MSQIAAAEKENVSDKMEKFSLKVNFCIFASNWGEFFLIKRFGLFSGC